MNISKKIIALTLTAALVLGAFAGCSKKTATKSETESTAESKVIKVAASATPHAEILEQVAPILAEQGYTLEVTVFDDYVVPNEVVESGEFDANYFQHTPYLNSFNEERGTHLVVAGEIHYEPFGIYPGTKTDFADIEVGDTIALPNDTTNEARALLLLQDNGLLTLADGVGLEATVNDIIDNPYELNFEELEAAQVARVVDEVEYVVLNGNYALEAGYIVSQDALAYEQADSVAATTYVNVIAVYEGRENDEAIQALVAALKSDEIVDYINTTYEGAVVPYVKCIDKFLKGLYIIRANLLKQ